VGGRGRWSLPRAAGRPAMLVRGALAWLRITPAALLVREPPQAEPAATAAAAPRDDPGFTVAQALTSPQLAAIALAFLACCAAHSGPIFHMITHAIDHNVSAMAATTVLSVADLASLGGRIICGLITDRIGAKRMLLIGLTMQAVTVNLYIFTASLGSFYALAVLFGFSYGGVMPLYAILI